MHIDYNVKQFLCLPYLWNIPSDYHFCWYIILPLEINLYASIKSIVPVGGFGFASLNSVFSRSMILAIELHWLGNRAPLFLSNPRDLIPSASFRFTLKSYQHETPLYFSYPFLSVSLFIIQTSNHAILYLSRQFMNYFLKRTIVIFNFPIIPSINIHRRLWIFNISCFNCL